MSSVFLALVSTVLLAACATATASVNSGPLTEEEIKPFLPATSTLADNEECVWAGATSKAEELGDPANAPDSDLILASKRNQPVVGNARRRAAANTVVLNAVYDCYGVSQ